LPEGEPFVFFDSDTLVTGPVRGIPFNFERPSASMQRDGTWPVFELHGPGYTATWRAFHDCFGLDFESSLDPAQPDEYWESYLHFNAGWFFHRCPREFGTRMLEIMLEVRARARPSLSASRSTRGSTRPRFRSRSTDLGAAARDRSLPRSTEPQPAITARCPGSTHAGTTMRWAYSKR
jgi:hypothetical protein